LLLCILLISPVTWAHYYLMATPALVLAALCVYRRLQRADAGGARLPGGSLVELVGLVFCCVIFFLADRYNDGSHRLLSALGVVLSCTAPLVLARLMRGAGVWLAQEPDRPEPI